MRQEGAAMGVPRAPKATVGCVDQYGAYSQERCSEVRSVEQLKSLHLGLLAEIPLNTLPAIARAVGLEDEQSFHHCLAHSPWEMAARRATRLQFVRQVVRDRPIIRCIEETGEKQKGQTTASVARQYSGNLGKLDHGMVSVEADGIVDEIPFP
jgi:SRSO17 transposase